MSDNDPNTASGKALPALERAPDGRFPKGVSGNPKGRPKGRRNEITLLKEELELALREQIAPDLHAVFAKIVELALEGDRTMLKLIADMHLTKGGSGDVRAGQEKVQITINGPEKREEIIEIVSEDDSSAPRAVLGTESTSGDYGATPKINPQEEPDHDGVLENDHETTH